MNMFEASKPYISPLVIDGMNGRILDLPAKESGGRPILALYGHHSSLERIFGLSQALNDYGRVIMPDLPGFGGMDSLYSIGQNGTLDEFADYLANFIEQNLPTGTFAIVGMSFGFIVATRMLQRHPELIVRVDMFVSMVGFVRGDDFKFSPRRLVSYQMLMELVSHELPSWVIAHTILAPSILRFWYPRVNRNSAKLHDASGEELSRRLEFELILWKINDVRTHLATYAIMFGLNLTTERVDCPLIHIETPNDQYFKVESVRRHLREIFTEVVLAVSSMKNHAPSILSSKDEARDMIPETVHKLLAERALEVTG
jgi:pimeloyl-ACP methyl ester carboxylesterase